MPQAGGNQGPPYRPTTYLQGTLFNCNTIDIHTCAKTSPRGLDLYERPLQKKYILFIQN